MYLLLLSFRAAQAQAREDRPAVQPGASKASYVLWKLQKLPKSIIMCCEKQRICVEYYMQICIYTYIYIHVDTYVSIYICIDLDIDLDIDINM